MRTAARRHAAVIAGLLLLRASAAAMADVQRADEQIGSWVSSCPEAAKRDACQLRHRNWVLPPGEGRPSAALEVQRRGDALVPVVTLRGLSAPAAIGGMLTLKATVNVRFDGGPRTGLACGLDGDAIVCAPDGAGVPLTAAQLPSAHSADVQILLSLPGMVALPPQDRAMDLQGTREALARFRRSDRRVRHCPPRLGWTGAAFWIACCAGRDSRTARPTCCRACPAGSAAGGDRLAAPFATTAIVSRPAPKCFRACLSERGTSSRRSRLAARPQDGMADRAQTHVDRDPGE